ncbi:PID-CTERM protein-sorting domain-containing protein [Urechidicola vernalis]|uniref:Uncharacterized protein n=1 Tax=Urechidicola vernalis TaxID=3075600 RepID=A0ABU2Y6B7_9FLAO|nr:hypothetical protein [Urechidicola sp. P050]MDT0553169.1 hypothetical protein [Urechidicola sp. P050]
MFAYRKLAVVALFLVWSAEMFAQGPPPPPPPPVGLPIDGGLIFLLVSGLLFGVSKIRKREE